MQIFAEVATYNLSMDLLVIFLLVCLICSDIPQQAAEVGKR